jgi:Fe-S oxidoreductase
VIATACPYCTTMIRDATTQLGCDEKVVTRDIAELVADAIEAPAAG